MDYTTVDFFLGANTEHGFHSHFEQMQDPDCGYHTYLIKGSPGSGKSTLMKRLADTITAGGDGGICERIHCSSDPNSLDGVIWHDKKVNIVDATPPHTMEPQHAGAVERIVSFYDAFDIPTLRQRTANIVASTAKISGLHKRFCEILHCMNLLIENNSNIITPTLDQKKMSKTIENLAHRTLKKQAGAPRPGKTQLRLISAFTPEGLLTYENTVITLCEAVYLLRDEYGVASDPFMRTMHALAIEKGYDCYLCYSPFHADGKIDHLLIPAQIGRAHV